MKVDLIDIDNALENYQINAIIDSSSNIAKFYNLLENTSLQRLLKKQLLENKSLKIGWGKLKKEL